MSTVIRVGDVVRATITGRVVAVGAGAAPRVAMRVDSGAFAFSPVTGLVYFTSEHLAEWVAVWVDVRDVDPVSPVDDQQAVLGV